MKPASKKKSTGGARVGETILRGGRKTVSVTKQAVSAFNKLMSEDSVKRTFKWKNFSFAKFILGFLALVLLLLFVFNTQNIDVSYVTVTVPGLNESLEGYRILVLSDLHGKTYGDAQATLLRTINGLSYNLVLCTGDMVGKGGDPQPFYDLLSGMTARRQVYFIAGDSDPGPLLSEPRDTEGTADQFVLADWILGAEALGAKYVDAPTSIKVSDATLWLTPAYMLSVNAAEELAKLQLEYKAQQDDAVAGDGAQRGKLPFSAYRIDCMQSLYDTLGQMEDGDMHISLSHMPVTLGYVATARENSTVVTDETNTYLRMVDLVLAGHYCGGVWRVPLVGALYIPNESADRYGWLPAQSEVQGLQSMNSAYQYVSAGLGATDAVNVPGFRLFNNAQVTVITLTATLPELK